MKISIISPQALKSERERLIQQAIELMLRQERSSIRYAKAMVTLRNKIERISKQLGEG
jgi:hypothetical protein